jgi:hypothetical protein
MVLFSPALTAYGVSEETVPSDTTGSFNRVQVPFVVNKGQIDNKEVAYFAKLISEVIHIDKNGRVTYNLSSPDKKAIVINEIFTEKKINLTAIEPPSETAIAVFQQKGQIPGDISIFYRLSYGAICEGIDLQLLAFTDTLEKIFTISPGGDPNDITIKLKGAEGLKVNNAGMLEIRTKQGPVTFSQPHAYQFMGEERTPVDVAYLVRKNAAYGFKLGSYDKTKPLFIAPVIPVFLLSAP